MEDTCEDYCEYVKAYCILMDYFDYFPDDIKEEIDDRLNRLGL